MPSSPNQQEQIDIRILRLIGLEDVFDLDYGTYLSLLKEVMVKGRMTKTSIPTEEIELVTQEFKRVRSKKDKGRFKVKSKKISASKLTGGSVAAIAGSVKALAPSMGSSLVAVSKTTAAGGESSGDILSEVKESLDRIAGLLTQQLANLKATGEKERRAAENKRREARETRLEKGFAVVTKIAKRIVAPVKSILDKIINFFVTIFLGKAVMKLLDWFGDPANKKKVDAIFRFLGDHWPKLIAGYLAFGTGLGRFITRLSVRLLRAIAMFALRNPKLAVAAGGIALGGLIANYLAKNNPFEKDKEKEEDITQFNQGGFVSGQKGIDKIPAMLTDGEFVMSRGAVQQFGLDTLLAMNAAGGGTNRPRVVSGVSFAQGGGPIGNVDTSAIAPMRAGMTAITKPLQSIRGSGLGGTVQLGFHGTSADAADKILSGGFRPGSAQNIYLNRGTFFAPSSGSMSKQGIIPQAAQEFMQRGGDVQRGALQRAFGAKSTGPGALIPGIYPQGATPFEMKIPGTKYAESLFSSKDADRFAQFGQRVMSGKYSRSAKAAQLLRTGQTTARLGGARAVGKTLGRFVPFANVGLGLADAGIRASQGDYVGSGLAGLSIVPGPIGWTALGAQMLYDAGRSGMLNNSKEYQPGDFQRRRAARRGGRPPMRFAGGPASNTPARTYNVPPPIQSKTMVRYVNTPSGVSGGGYNAPAVSTREIPTFSAVIADSRRRSKAAQLGIG